MQGLMSHSVVDLPWLPAPPQDFALQCRGIGADAGNEAALIQFLARARLTDRQSTALARAIARCRSADADLSPLSKFRLGVLSSGTFDLHVDSFPAAAARHGVVLELLTTPYDQVMQQALDPASAINNGALDGVLVAIDHRWLSLDRPDLEAANDRVAAAMQKMLAVVEGLRTHGHVPAILQTLPMPPVALFGSYDRRVRGTIRCLIDEANWSIARLADETGSYLLDVAALAERIGTDRWFDPVRWAAFKLPFAAECFPIYADILGRLIGTIRGKARKCLVLDLDNTVWGGAVGDDGIGGIHIGQGSARGESFLAIQRAALDLRDRGIVLAVCSKNDEAVARSVFREHTEMLLRENHISVFQANWSDKPSNLRAIAEMLNIGVDALVFVDDNPAERAQVRAALPEVAVPELPGDPAWFSWYLDAAGYFEAVNFSTEDRLRVNSYDADRRRVEIRAMSEDLGDYLSSLEMEIKFASFDNRSRQRITQLINKTNQFNLTTKRYTEQTVAEIEEDKSLFSLQVRLADKFGDLGMIGVVICRPGEGDAATWNIDTWLMSCRVLGRRVEQAMLSKIASEGRARGVSRLVGLYVPTNKNNMVADHYEKLGFRLLERDSSGRSTWECDVLSYSAPEIPMTIIDGFLLG